jgi:hypothetical protein
MDRARLLAEIAAADAPADGVLHLERLAEDYRWRFVGPDAAAMTAGLPAAGPAPDAWMFYSGPWPAGPPSEVVPFVEDLLAEMESMCGGADRCRWPLDQPYPVRH